jgi:hypothetical protein
MSFEAKSQRVKTVALIKNSNIVYAFRITFSLDRVYRILYVVYRKQTILKQYTKCKQPYTSLRTTILGLLGTICDIHPSR